MVNSENIKAGDARDLLRNIAFALHSIRLFADIQQSAEGKEMGR
jgi:hypothetical protein